MTQASPILALPYLMPSQAQKHVTHNEALQMLDALVQLSAEGFDAATPPASPDLGETHVLAASPSGAWAGHGAEIAVWQGEGWLFLAPRPGWRAWGAAEGELRIWDGSAWILPPAATQNLARVGVGTTADAANPLSVAGPATLLTHAGSGHQLKLNKAAATDTAALLLQTSWSVGAWTGGGADYAEWFEWADGNPGADDRRGISVVLEGARIRPADPGETPAGVISASPAVIGDGDMGGWKGRWQRDDYGALLRDAEGRPLENPAYDPTRAYLPREARPEWALVGLLGKLRLRRGQPVAPGWIRMRQAAPEVEEWLVR